MIPILVPFTYFEDCVRSMTRKDRRLQALRVHSLILQLHQTITPKNDFEKAREAWEGSEPQLCLYGILLAESLITEGGGWVPLLADLNVQLGHATSGEYSMDKPWWWGNFSIHRSHRQALISSDPKYYRPLFEKGLRAGTQSAVVWPEPKGA